MLKMIAEKLRAGEIVRFRPKGNSMQGRIESGQLVTVTPNFYAIVEDDIVLCKVKGRYMLHLVKAIKGKLILIGNNKGFINGWTNMAQIYGKLISVE